MAAAPTFTEPSEPKVIDADPVTPDTPPQAGKVDRKGRPTTRAGRRAVGEGTTVKRERAPKGTTAAARPTLAQLEKSVAELVALPGMLLSAKCMDCGQHLVTNAERVAGAWIELARTDDRVRRMLEQITTGSALGGAITTTALVVLPVLGAHTKLPVPALLGNPHDHTKDTEAAGLAAVPDAASA